MPSGIYKRTKPIWNKGKSKYPEVNYKPYFCDCGCGGICTHGRRFVSGHNSRTNNPWKTYKNRHEYGNPGAEKVKELWRNPNWRKETIKSIFKASHVRPNYKELVLDKLIQSVRPGEFQYVGDGKVIIEGKCPDWINVNGKKQIIELFGCNWHEPKDEEIRKLYFSKYGYSVLVIWEYELTEYDFLVEKLRRF